MSLCLSSWCFASLCTVTNGCPLCNSVVLQYQVWFACCMCSMWVRSACTRPAACVRSCALISGPVRVCILTRYFNHETMGVSSDAVAFWTQTHVALDNFQMYYNQSQHQSLIRARRGLTTITGFRGYLNQVNMSGSKMYITRLLVVKEAQRYHASVIDCTWCYFSGIG